MKNNRYQVSDEVEAFGVQMQNLCKLQIAIIHAQEFGKLYSKYLEPKDKVAIAKANLIYDQTYHKYLDKFIKKVRGL